LIPGLLFLTLLKGSWKEIVKTNVSAMLEKSIQQLNLYGKDHGASEIDKKTLQSLKALGYTN
jgi:hypothetical protein